MKELELSRASEDRRLFRLGDVGTIRLQGFLSRAATAESDGVRWHFSRRGIWGGCVATDETGATVGLFEAQGFRRRSAVRWGDRELTLRAASAWRERYALVDGETELAILDGKSWGRRPVSVEVDDLSALEPGLLLFAVYVVRGLAEDASAAASVAVTTATPPG